MMVIEALATLVTGFDFTQPLTNSDRTPDRPTQRLYDRVQQFSRNQAAHSAPVPKVGPTTSVMEKLPRKNSIDVIPLSSSWKQTSEILDGLRDPLGVLLFRALFSPPVPGYEDLLIKAGVSPVAARPAGYLLLRRGHRSVRDRARYPAVFAAIRFLAKPGRQRAAVRRRATLLLATWQETSVIETIFDVAGLCECRFIALLKYVAGEDTAVQGELSTIAATIVPRLPPRLGRRTRPSSAAHEFLLENSPAPIAYTWNDLVDDFVDPATMATRMAFGEPDFDPRPASRRNKALKNIAKRTRRRR